MWVTRSLTSSTVVGLPDHGAIVVSDVQPFGLVVTTLVVGMLSAGAYP